MTDLVLDCSVTMAWLFEDEASDYSEALLSRMERGAAASVPPLWVLEVTNVLLVAERRNRITVAQSSGFLEVLRGFDIHHDESVVEGRGSTILDLGRRYGLYAYDAAYLELAIRSGLPLATLDKGLQRAVSAAGAALWR